ncbi:MAG: hypothetical protein J6D03_05880 [Clostridia bacterium]|nr:hypothetical protein [Clostridia bacterium]
MIAVSNNKKKSLQKAKIIINFDLKQDEISKYQINRNAVIINLSDNIMKMEKSFNGIIINSMQITNINYKIRNYYLFEYIDLYESYIFEEKRLEKALDKIEKDNIIIKGLLGERGRIQNMEYTKIA